MTVKEIKAIKAIAYGGVIWHGYKIKNGSACDGTINITLSLVAEQ